MVGDIVRTALAELEEVCLEFLFALLGDDGRDDSEPDMAIRQASSSTCAPVDAFVGPYYRNEREGSDPPAGHWARVTLSISEAALHRIIVRQGAQEGAPESGQLVASLHGDNSDGSKTVYVVSDGGELSFQISRCDGQDWLPDQSPPSEVTRSEAVTSWSASSDGAELAIAFGAAIDREAWPTAVGQAIRRFAPELRLHPNDPYRPASVPWYLARVRLRWHRPSIGPILSDVEYLRKGKINVRRLISQNHKGNRSGQRGRGRTRSNFFLQIPNDGAETKTRRGHLPSAECYTYFRPALGGHGEYDITYWFFYAYNGDITTVLNPAHEGDWEHMTVRVSADLQRIVKVFFATHKKESRWYNRGYSLNASGHPIGYSARHSHATYPSAGEQPRRGLLPNDHTAEGGPVWETERSIVPIGTFDSPAAGQEWIRYTGHWGEIGAPVTSGKLVSSGPFGPAFQEWWEDDSRML